MKHPSISPKFLDIVENGYASEENPHRAGIFIRSLKRTGRMNPGKYMLLTDGIDDFWEVGYDNDRLKIVGNYIRQFISHKEEI